MVSLSNNDLVRMVGPNTPLRLKDAVALAFPAGGMTLSGLRKEIAKGRLSVEMIAGKQFVTLADIDRMRELCRANANPPASGKSLPAMAGQPFGSSKTVAGPSAQESLRNRLILLHQKQQSAA
jgi:hypothetical protein